MKKRVKNKIKFCCPQFQDAYNQYKVARSKESWPECLDRLSWAEMKLILILIESFIERKCMFCHKTIVMPKQRRINKWINR